MMDADVITDLGHEVFQIDTRMAGYDGITAGYLIRGDRPCLVETGHRAVRAAGRGTRWPRSASGRGTWPRSWSPTSTSTTPAAPATSRRCSPRRRSSCTSSAPGTWPTRPG